MNKFTYCIFSLFLCNAAAFSQAGTLDPAFGTGGIVITDAAEAGGFNLCTAIKACPDGKIIGCGYAENPDFFSYDVLVIRYNADGSLDETFATAGIYRQHFTSGYYYAQDLALQPDGKIVVVGSLNYTDAFIMRLNHDGSIDNSFSSEGYYLAGTGLYPSFNAVILQSDGRILVAGSLYSADATGADFLIRRFTADGSVDTGFGTEGTVIIDGFESTDKANEIALQSDGKIVVAGKGYNANYDMMVVRLTTEGTPDISFAFEGKNLIDLRSPGASKDHCGGIAIQEDGRIVLSGATNVPGGDIYDLAIVRLNTNGFPDSTFHEDGILTIDKCGLDYLNDVAIQSDGKILACGETECLANDGLIVRLLPDGTLDPTFGIGGYVQSPSPQTGYSMDIQADGKIIMAGDNFYDFVVARFLNDEIPPCLAAPSGIYADNIQSDKTKLHWNSDPFAIKYKLQYRPSASAIWINANATTNFKKITGLTANTSYKYRIRSVCEESLLSPWSAIETFMTLPLRESLSGEPVMMNIYPNPNTGTFSIQVNTSDEQNISISIKNMLGEEIYSEQSDNPGLIHAISLNKNIPAGMYVVYIKTKDSIFSEQMMIGE